MNSDFNFFIEADFEKASKDKSKKYDNMVLWGKASDSSEDSDKETLEPNGYILDRFLKSGYVNYEHLSKKSSKYIVGEPTDAKVKNNEFFVKAKLWKDSEVARDLWDTVNTMKSSGSNRKIGWSIEGKALQRDPSNEKRITKALITNIALTFSPKNKNSWADISKGNYEEPYIKAEFDESANGGAEYLLDITRPDDVRITIDKEFNVKIGKAMSAGTGTGTDLTNKDTSGAALKTESLNKKLINLQPEFVDAIKVIASKKHKLSDDILKNVKKSIKSFLFNN
jgi:hypothetical protein